jgi:hypothetical protein
VFKFHLRVVAKGRLSRARIIPYFRAQPDLQGRGVS